MLHAAWLLRLEADAAAALLGAADPAAGAHSAPRLAAVDGIVRPLAAAGRDPFMPVLAAGVGSLGWTRGELRSLRASGWLALDLYQESLLATVWGVGPGEPDGWHRCGRWAPPGAPLAGRSATADWSFGES